VTDINAVDDAVFPQSSRMQATMRDLSKIVETVLRAHGHDVAVCSRWSFNVG
jgi:hypothetical protein